MAGVARNQQPAARRRQELLELLRRRGNVAAADLPEVFGVSAETVRRDLRILEDQHEVVRAYGSVRAAESGTFETTKEFRAAQFADEKARIAQEACARLGRAETVFLDEGHLPLVIGRALPTDRGLTVITTSLPAAAELARRPGLTIISVGGRVRPSTLGVVDQWALSVLGSMEPDLAFIGANGVTAEGWLTTPDPAVAAIKQAAIAVAHRRIFVGDHSKFDHSTFVRFARLADFECVVTDHELSGSAARRYSALGTEVVRV
ncbi:DeoR/GlpR family DNA-binding transcription regulator [Actinomyces provencensis]|uniref:DeoR/GlpR family DNA-binding transcription regulator n=1 Tax=Actinomyces provencensis TaxID=1720198 RepID=UPI00096A459C|nr:DeoR/GlpR family DNA-binding transcription regulator [Actinomyces provencensis]